MDVPEVRDDRWKPLATGDLSPEAHEGWHAFAAFHGTSLTALMEVFGRRLVDQAPDVIAPLTPLLIEAKSLSHRRGRRGHRVETES